MNLRRILMAAADESPGSGTSLAPVAPTEPQAQGAAPLDVAAIVRDAVKESQNSIFAELRRSGVLGKPSKSKDEATTAATPAPSSQQPQPSLRNLDRALTKMPHVASKLNDAQYARLERAYTEEAPSDTVAWLRDYYGDLVADNPTTATTTTAQPATRTDRPASDRGSPAPSAVPLEERRLVDLSPSDVQSLIKQKGTAWYKKTFFEQSRGMTVKLR